MKNIIIMLLTSLILIGCNEPVHNDNSLIDLSWLFSATVEPEPCPVCPAQEETIYGQISDITDKIDANRVTLNHYVNEVQIEENLADIFDINGSIVTQNAITMPAYTGEEMKHVLIVRFYQVK